MPFRIALSGLDAASTNLKVTGNNIANAATTGYKSSRTEFADLYANSIQDSSSASSGQGVKVSRVAQQFAQGNMEFTTNNLDLAINGGGFFVVEDGSGSPAYTRAGTFSIDRNGRWWTVWTDRSRYSHPSTIPGPTSTQATPRTCFCRPFPARPPPPSRLPPP